MALHHDLKQLEDAGILTPETSEKIRAWYEGKKAGSPNRLLILFGILGALLVGLGIILVVAHNWDTFSRPVRTFFALLPLALGQVACLVGRLRFPESIAWRESPSVFLFFAVGASIAIVSQIYHLGGDLSTFLLTWIVLGMPLVYLMGSSTVSLLSLVFLTAYAWVSTDDGFLAGDPPYLYLGLLGALMPHYITLLRRTPESNFTLFHHWVVPLSVSAAFGALITGLNELIAPAYLALFGIFLCLSKGVDSKRFEKSYSIIGSLGSIWVLLTMSFAWFWQSWKNQSVELNPQMYLATAIGAASLLILVLTARRNKTILYEPLFLSFPAVVILLVAGKYDPAVHWLVNGFVLLIGVTTIVRGSRVESLGIMNYGMGIITALIVLRFFDSNMSFIVRGILFIASGAGFFLLNYLTLKNRRSHE